MITMIAGIDNDFSPVTSLEWNGNTVTINDAEYTMGDVVTVYVYKDQYAILDMHMCIYEMTKTELLDFYEHMTAGMKADTNAGYSVTYIDALGNKHLVIINAYDDDDTKVCTETGHMLFDKKNN
jgi:hypothetical protein